MNATECPAAQSIEVITPPGFSDLSVMLRAASTRYFAMQKSTAKPITLRVHLSNVQEEMLGFTASGALASTAVRLRVSVDFVQGTRILWSGRSTPFTGTVPHHANPQVSMNNQNEVMHQQINRALDELGLRFRQRCNLKLNPRHHR